MFRLKSLNRVGVMLCFVASNLDKNLTSLSSLSFNQKKYFETVQNHYD
jgi:hypothetical protein